MDEPLPTPLPLIAKNGDGIIETDDADRSFWMAYRKSLLDMLDAIERRMGIRPTTAELRRLYRQNKSAATQ